MRIVLLKYLSFMKHILLSAVIFVVLFVNSFAQINNCVFDDFMQKNQRINIDVQKKESTINESISNKVKAGIVKSNTVLYVPVVFHVMHLNGIENVADSILLKELNNTNAYFSNSSPFYNPDGVNTNIQFCLASKDPFGNATNGITRHFTPYTNVSVFGGPNFDIDMKSINRWNPYRYLNVWIVNSVLDFNGAYSTLPASKGGPSDGIVITYASLGFNRSILAHEAGHYLGLYHHFEGVNCSNFDCTMDGDKICDTPPEMPFNYRCDTNTCNTDMNDTSGFNPFSIDEIDISSIMTSKQNCNYIFTPNQAQRMYTVLTQVRHELLTSIGCGVVDTTSAMPTAMISYSEFSCNFSRFESQSSNYEYLEWDIDGDGVFEEYLDSLTHKFNTTNYYTITLRAFNNGNVDYDSLTVLIHARPNTIYPLQSISGLGSYGLCSGKTALYTAIPNMVSYLWSTGETTSSIQIQSDSTFYLGLSCVDTTGYVWKLCPDTLWQIPVVQAPPKPIISSLSNDSLCAGQIMNLHVDVAPSAQIVTWFVNNNWTYNTSTDFTLGSSISNFNVQVLITDSQNCNVYSDTMRYYFDPLITQPYNLYIIDTTIWANYLSNNQFYKDGVAIPGATQYNYTFSEPGCYSVFSWYGIPECGAWSDTICITTVKLNDIRNASAFEMFPNPSSGKIYINSKQNLFGNLCKVCDLAGNVVREFIIPQKQNQLTEIDATNLAKGMYFITVGNATKKIILN